MATTNFWNHGYHSNSPYEKTQLNGIMLYAKYIFEKNKNVSIRKKLKILKHRWITRENNFKSNLIEAAPYEWAFDPNRSEVRLNVPENRAQKSSKKFSNRVRNTALTAPTSSSSSAFTREAASPVDQSSAVEELFEEIPVGDSVWDDEDAEILNSTKNVIKHKSLVAQGSDDMHEVDMNRFDIGKRKRETGDMDSGDDISDERVTIRKHQYRSDDFFENIDEWE